MKDYSLKKAATINILGKFSSVFVNLIYLAILSRILNPEEFGIIAVVTVFTTLFVLLADMGIGPAIVQNKLLKEEDYKSIFVFTIYVAFALVTIFSSLALPISMIYNNNIYISIVLLLNISLFFNTINIVPNALMMKNYRFKAAALRTVAVAIVIAIPTIILAFRGWSYYSLVFYSIALSIANFVWNYLFYPLKPSYRFKKSSILKILDYSKYLYFFSMVNYLARNIDNLLIGKFLGEGQLGYYNKGYQLMTYPVTYLTHSITPVIHPILSNFQHDHNYIYEKYTKLVRFLSLLGIFVSSFVFFSSKEIITLFFGDQWDFSIPVLKMLSLSIWAQMITSSTGSIFQSLNKTKLMFVGGIISTSIIILTLTIGLAFGDITSVALFISIAYNLILFETFIILVRFGFKKKFLSFFKILIPNLIMMGILFVISYFVFSNISFENLFVSVLFKLTVSTLIYVILLIITGEYKIIFMFLPVNKIKNIFRKKK